MDDVRINVEEISSHPKDPPATISLRVQRSPSINVEEISSHPATIKDPPATIPLQRSPSINSFNPFTKDGKSHDKHKPQAEPSSFSFNLSSSNFDLSQTTCPICNNPLSSKSIQMNRLKQRFVRHIRRTFPKLDLSDSVRVCFKDLHNVLQNRIDQLLDEDQVAFSQLQEDAMKFLHSHELQEEKWQEQFDTKRSIGEKSADNVAKYAGSWGFVIGVLLFLAAWSSTNAILFKFQSENENFAWDPYPFTLLNLFLSVIAALQGPIIMMSQNRQQQMDRAQSGYISKMILRGEHQTRHVNAKMDYLITSQWRRLLEIQEIQVDLLQILQAETNTKKKEKKKDESFFDSYKDETMVNENTGILDDNNLKSKIKKSLGVQMNQQQSLPIPWNLEIIPDDHARMLLRHFYRRPDLDDKLLFSRWSEEGDNFYGTIRNVQLDIENLKSSSHKSRGWIEIGGGVNLQTAQVLKRITYEIYFEGQKAQLDDVFSGDGTIKIRNDFDIDHMFMNGRIRKVEIYSQERPNVPTIFQNGDLPTRYKPSFSNNFKRSERIVDFWRTNLHKVVITYSPPHQVSILSVGKDYKVKNIVIDIHRPEDNKFGDDPQVKNNFSTKVFLATGQLMAEPIRFLEDLSVTGLDQNEWKEVATAEFEAKARSADGDVVSIRLAGMELVGPNIYVFLNEDARTAVHGVYEKISLQQ